MEGQGEGGHLDIFFYDVSDPVSPRPLGRIPKLGSQLPYATSITTVEGKLAGRE